MNQPFIDEAREVDEQVARGEEGVGLERVDGTVSPNLLAVYEVGFTREEIALLRSKAAELGLNFSDYVRNAALTTAGVVVRRTAETRNRSRQRVGHSVNSLIDIEGIGATYAKTLADADLTNTDHLLDAAGSASGRKTLATKTGLTEAKILEWVKRADLMRVKGIGGEYSNLLEAAGVDTVKELATRVPANLQAKLAEVNEAKKLVRRVPTESEVSGWVAEAKTLPAKVTH